MTIKKSIYFIQLVIFSILFSFMGALESCDSNSSKAKTNSKVISQNKPKKKLSLNEDPLSYFVGDYKLVQSNSENEIKTIKVKFLKEEEKISVYKWGTFKYSIEIRGEDICLCLKGSSTKQGELLLTPYGEAFLYKRSGDKIKTISQYKKDVTEK